MEDRKFICPCYRHEKDIAETGHCICHLFVSDDCRPSEIDSPPIREEDSLWPIILVYGAEWCRDLGRSDECSLKISNTGSGPTEWPMDRESDGAWTQKWTPSIGFRVTAYIKTENVEGRGSFLALRWAVYNHPERFPYICSRKLVGTNDWTRVEAEIHGPPPADISALGIVLRQDGSGTTWFDDLEVEILTIS